MDAFPGGLGPRDRYVSLTTSRRDGTPVATPVWFAPLPDGRLAVVTDADAGKLKRLRRQPRCEVAACDVRGGITGPSLTATGEVVTDPTAMRAGLTALGRRYGWQWRAFNLARTLRRVPTHEGRALLILTVADAS